MVPALLPNRGNFIGIAAAPPTFVMAAVLSWITYRSHPDIHSVIESQSQLRRFGLWHNRLHSQSSIDKLPQWLKSGLSRPAPSLASP
jgi:hypothetical protein